MAQGVIRTGCVTRDTQCVSFKGAMLSCVKKGFSWLNPCKLDPVGSCGSMLICIKREPLASRTAPPDKLSEHGGRCMRECEGGRAMTVPKPAPWTRAAKSRVSRTVSSAM